jgi:integrase/recombinase XerD
MSKDWLKPFMVKLPKAEKKLKETYTDTELSLLLKKPIIKKVLFSEYRNWVMVNFLIGTGVRLNSLINIKIEDLDLDSDVVKLTKTKARNQVILPLSGSLVQILKEYLNYRKGEEDSFLFCSQYGEQLTKDGTENIIQKYNHARGVNKSSIHLFRHSLQKDIFLMGAIFFDYRSLCAIKISEALSNILTFVRMI